MNHRRFEASWCFLPGFAILEKVTGEIATWIVLSSLRVGRKKGVEGRKDLCSFLCKSCLSEEFSSGVMGKV